MCLQGSSLNPTRMNESYDLIYGSAAAATGVSPINARYLLHYFSKNKQISTLINVSDSTYATS